MPAPLEGGAAAADTSGRLGIAPGCLLPSPTRDAGGPSRRLLNTAARIATAAASRSEGEGAQVLGFTPRDFVVFGLPYRNPGP